MGCLAKIALSRNVKKKLEFQDQLLIGRFFCRTLQNSSGFSDCLFVVCWSPLESPNVILIFQKMHIT